MEIDIFRSFQWWIAAIEVPVITTLFILITKAKKDAEYKLEQVKNLTQINYIQVKDALLNYKLEVAKSYASINSLKEVEKRLVEHLLRIEEKLENKRKIKYGKKF